LVWQQVIGFVVQSTNPGMDKTFSLVQNVHTIFGDLPASYSIGTGVLSGGYSGWGMKSNTHLHLVLRVRMSGVIQLLPLYAFIMFTGTALPFQYFSLLWHCVMTVKFHAELMQQMTEMFIVHLNVLFCCIRFSKILFKKK
jgi:hypothetical protein